MDVIFFPRKDYDVEICTHRLGKKMTYTEQTDTLRETTSYPLVMAMATQRNIKVGGFAQYDDYSNTIIEDCNSGKIWLDIYSYDPALSSKISTGQTITQEEWENSYENVLLPPYLSAFGKKPIALSYSYGNTTFADYVTPLLLGARNSGYNGDTDYGNGYGDPNTYDYSFSRYKSKISTFRWYDQAKTNGNDFSGQLAIVSAKIDETKLNGGWINNFTHWHSVLNDDNMSVYEDYFDLLATKNANNEIYFAGYGEAIAYLVYRQLITKSVMYSPITNASTQLIIRLEVDNTLNIDTDLLQVPISIKFSTTGTPLANKTLTSDCNLVSLGNGEYIVEIPYGQGGFPYAIINGQ